MCLEEVTFQQPQLEDKALIEEYLKRVQRNVCDLTFTNIYLWSRFFKTKFAIYKNTLLFCTGEKGDCALSFPIGYEKDIKPVLEDIRHFFQKTNQKLRLYLVTPDKFAWLEGEYPGVYAIEYQRDIADYVYDREKLATLSGKKYHGKRNHINRFIEDNPDWSYEPMSRENIEECFQMSLVWRKENDASSDEEKSYEVAMTQNSLRLFEELGLSGGVLRVGGRVVAFTIGEELNDTTFVVHIEKAFADIQGAYPMINREFVRQRMEGYVYVNREEDTGSEGLRQAKLSYRPVFLSEKGMVTLREETS